MNEQRTTQTQPEEISEAEINAQHQRVMAMRLSRAERPALALPRSPESLMRTAEDQPPPPTGGGSDDGSGSGDDDDGSGLVNTPITWPQLIGGWLSDYTDPAVILAFLGALYVWIGGAGPVTWRLAATAVLGAVIAAEQAILRRHGMDGLARRLKARGQIDKGTG
jgi:hypothetical protein